MTQKKVYLEWIRVIAIVLVIFNHLPAFALFRQTTGARQALSMFLSMGVRINIPLFLMVSGAVLLSKRESYLTVLRRRVARFAAVILLFCLGLYLLHYFYYTQIKGIDYALSPVQFLYGVFFGSIEGTGSYWFLYMFLGYLLMLPFLQKLAPGLDRQDFIALVALHAVVNTGLPVLNLLLSAVGAPAFQLSVYFTLPLAAEQAMFFPLVGAYLDRAVDVRGMRRSTLAIIALVGVGSLILACLCTYWQAGLTGLFTEQYVNLMDYAAGMAVFLLIKRLVTVSRPGLEHGRAAHIVCLAGSLTFGIYLLDPYLKVALWGPYSKLTAAFLPPVLQSLGWCVLSVALGGGLTFLLKKLPVMRKLL